MKLKVLNFQQRKPEEEESGEVDTKKTKQEDGSGDATTKQNGTMVMT